MIKHFFTIITFLMTISTVSLAGQNLVADFAGPSTDLTNDTVGSYFPIENRQAKYLFYLISEMFGQTCEGKDCQVEVAQLSCSTIPVLGGTCTAMVVKTGEIQTALGETARATIDVLVANGLRCFEGIPTSICTVPSVNVKCKSHKKFLWRNYNCDVLGVD